MKIALVSPYDWCVPGGVRDHITHLAGAFRGWGHEVHIFAPASEPELVAGQITPMGRPFSMRVNGSIARISLAWKSPAVKRLLDREQFDVVHIHEPLMPLLPYHFLRYSSSATIGTFHAAKDGGNRFYTYTMPFTRRWFRRLEGKIAVSPVAAGLISRYYPGYYNIIPNGIDYEHYATRRDPLPEFADGRVNILFIGRPEKRKGLKYLLRAYLRVRQQEPNVRLIVVGHGDFTRYANMLRAFPDIVFRSNVSHEEKPRYHHTAQIFCSPNTGGESQGIALLEAMAAGLSAVASNIEGFATMMTHEVEGLLFRPRDVASLEAALLRLVRDPNLRARLGVRAQARAEQYSWDSVAHSVFSYYERLLYERRQVVEARHRRPPVHAT